MAFEDERAEGECFSGCPIQGLFAGGHFCPQVIKALQLALDRETVRHFGQRGKNARNRFRIDGRVGQLIGWLDAADVTAPVTAERLQAGHVRFFFGGFKFALEFILAHVGDGIGFLARQFAHFQQAIEIAFAHTRSFIDRPVHDRLGEAWFVRFVVTPAAIGIHIDDHIAAELAAEIHGQAHDLSHGFWVFTVDMKDRNLQHFGDIGRVGTRTASSASVVKPTWLLMMTCRVPPVV